MKTDDAGPKTNGLVNKVFPCNAETRLSELRVLLHGLGGSVWAHYFTSPGHQCQRNGKARAILAPTQAPCRGCKNTDDEGKERFFFAWKKSVLCRNVGKRYKSDFDSLSCKNKKKSYHAKIPTVYPCTRRHAR